MEDYREIFEKFPDGVTLHDPGDGSILGTNEKMCEMLGYTQSEFQELSFDDLHLNEPPYTIDRAEEYLKKAAHQGPQTFEWISRTKTGEPLPIEVHLSQTTIDGDQRILAVVRDISDRKSREKKLSRLRELSQELMYTDSLEETACLAVEGAEEIIGAPLSGCHLLNEAEDTLEPTVVAAAVEDEFDELRGYRRDAEQGSRSAVVWQVYETGTPLFIDDAQAHEPLTESTPARSAIIHPLGEHGVFIVSSPDANKFDRTDEDLVEILATSLTSALDRVERERTLRDHSRRLERHNERLEKFARLVSHDLRNPLNVAQGRLSLAAEDCESDDLEAVARAHRRMQELLEDLLSLARAGELVGEKETVELAELVELCWRNVETESAQLEVETTVSINADRSRLQQLLENLFRNAVEHAGEEVTITVGDLADGFYVEDDGPGIPADIREQVFEPGYSSTDEGTGFGLSIVREVAEAHRWDVRATSGSDGGARFEVTSVDIA
jgi:PAS domain S-box-containing protein